MELVPQYLAPRHASLPVKMAEEIRSTALLCLGCGVGQNRQAQPGPGKCPTAHPAWIDPGRPLLEDSSHFVYYPALLMSSQVLPPFLIRLRIPGYWIILLIKGLELLKALPDMPERAHRELILHVTLVQRRES
jgi:hypothetical protein